jgi:hypothetical protein
MTLSVSDQVSPVGNKLVVDTDCNATAKNSVTGSAGTIYQIDIDNSNNVTEAVFLKIYDDAAPTVGTTAPDFVIKVPTNQRRSMAIPEGFDFTNLSIACVTAGGTAGVTDPTTAVTVRMVTS